MPSSPPRAGRPAPDVGGRRRRGALAPAASALQGKVRQVHPRRCRGWRAREDPKLHSSKPAPTRVLILGGTTEATALAHALATRDDVEATLSYAGRTREPSAQPVTTRIGGFGGADGLAAYLRDGGIDVLVDATHPFAAQMSRHAREAAAHVGCELVVVARPAWMAGAGDAWIEVGGLAEAIDALGDEPRRVFLAIGRLQLAAFASAPQHWYLVRTIEPVEDAPIDNALYIEGRGPFDRAQEARLMRDHRIDVVVTKNSGGAASSAKLEAARDLGLPVVLLRRPHELDGSRTVEAALAAIVAHGAARRGV